MSSDADVDVHYHLFRCKLSACTLAMWPVSSALFLTATAVSNRLVVIPDAHGDKVALESALALAQVPLQRSTADEDRTHVVSLGDSVDRGPDPKGCYKLLQAVQATCLLGNHDWVNLLGIAPHDDPSTPHREDLYAPYVIEEDLGSFGGWAQRQEAFGPHGELGREIREHFNIVSILPGPWHQQRELPPLEAAATLFVHAGISWKLAQRYNSVADMAAEARRALALSLAGDDHGLLTELFDEVLQMRDLAYGRGQRTCDDLERSLAHLGAARLVVGHTPQQTRRAEVKCGGRLVLLDVAMSRWLINVHRPEQNAHPVALEARYDGNDGEEKLQSLRALYQNEVVNLPPFDRDQPEL